MAEFNKSRCSGSTWSQLSLLRAAVLVCDLLSAESLVAQACCSVLVSQCRARIEGRAEGLWRGRSGAMEAPKAGDVQVWSRPPIAISTAFAARDWLMLGLKALGDQSVGLRAPLR